MRIIYAVFLLIVWTFWPYAALADQANIEFTLAISQEVSMEVDELYPLGIESFEIKSQIKDVKVSISDKEQLAVGNINPLNGQLEIAADQVSLLDKEQQISISVY